jgi:hypothetical protein
MENASPSNLHKSQAKDMALTEFLFKKKQKCQAEIN